LCMQVLFRTDKDKDNNNNSNNNNVLEHKTSANIFTLQNWVLKHILILFYLTHAQGIELFISLSFSGRVNFSLNFLVASLPLGRSWMPLNVIENHAKYVTYFASVDTDTTLWSPMPRIRAALAIEKCACKQLLKHSLQCTEQVFRITCWKWIQYDQIDTFYVGL